MDIFCIEQMWLNGAMKRKTRSIWRQILKDRSLWLVLVGAVALLIGLFLPWYTADTGQGVVRPGLGITNDTGLVLAVLTVVTVVSSVSINPLKPKNAEILAVVASVLISLILLNNYPDNLVGEVISTDQGYWMGVGGVAGMFLGALSGINITDTTHAASRKQKRRASKK